MLVPIRTHQTPTHFNKSLTQLLVCRFDGVLADLSDISCLYGTPEFDTIQDKALAGQVQQV